MEDDDNADDPEDPDDAEVAHEMGIVRLQPFVISFVECINVVVDGLLVDIVVTRPSGRLPSTWEEEASCEY